MKENSSCPGFAHDSCTHIELQNSLNQTTNAQPCHSANSLRKNPMEKFRSGYPQIDQTQVRQFTHKTLQTASPNHTKQELLHFFKILSLLYCQLREVLIKTKAGSTFQQTSRGTIQKNIFHKNREISILRNIHRLSYS